MFEEQHLHQPPALRRESGQGFADQLFFLSLLQQTLGDSRCPGHGQIRLCIPAHQALLLPLPSEALVVGYKRQPFRKRPWLAKFGQALQQFYARCLKDFSGFVLWETILNGDREDQRLVFFD